MRICLFIEKLEVFFRGKFELQHGVRIETLFAVGGILRRQADGGIQRQNVQTVYPPAFAARDGKPVQGRSSGRCLGGITFALFQGSGCGGKMGGKRRQLRKGCTAFLQAGVQLVPFIQPEQTGKNLSRTVQVLRLQTV